MRISRWLLLALSVVALSPALLRAQQPIQRATGAAVTVDLRTDDPRSDPRMNEDIEIFRRILDRKLKALYPRSLHASMGGTGMSGGMAGMSGGMAGMSGGMAGMSGSGFGGMQGGMMGMSGGMAGMSGGTIWVEAIGNPIEGVYLKGHGVVYTATLSSLQPPRSSGKAEAPKPVSEWDSIRREVRNEKEKPKPPEPSKPPALSDVLLKILAENGQHFSRLGENESITLVLTVHEKSATRSDQKSARPPSQPPSPPKTADQAKARDLELLGDLHMKQEHYGQARDAFREAIARKPGRHETAALARKLAQAYLMLSKIEEARAALDQAIALTKETPEPKDKPPAKPAAPTLPVKLIVSAPKKLLDQAGEKKISFEEFRRRASVETLRFEEGSRR